MKLRFNIFKAFRNSSEKLNLLNFGLVDVTFNTIKVIKGHSNHSNQYLEFVTQIFNSVVINRYKL